MQLDTSIEHRAQRLSLSSVKRISMNVFSLFCFYHHHNDELCYAKAINIQHIVMYIYIYSAGAVAELMPLVRSVFISFLLLLFIIYKILHLF